MLSKKSKKVRHPSVIYCDQSLKTRDQALIVCHQSLAHCRQYQKNVTNLRMFFTNRHGSVTNHPGFYASLLVFLNRRKMIDANGQQCNDRSVKTWTRCLFQRRVGLAQFERRPTIGNRREIRVGRRGEAPLVPPYSFRSLNKAMALEESPVQWTLQT